MFGLETVTETETTFLVLRRVLCRDLQRLCFDLLAYGYCTTYMYSLLAGWFYHLTVLLVVTYDFTGKHFLHNSRKYGLNTQHLFSSVILHQQHI